MDKKQIINSLNCAINDLDSVQSEMYKLYQDYDIDDPENLYEVAYQTLVSVENLLDKIE